MPGVSLDCCSAEENSALFLLVVSSKCAPQAQEKVARVEPIPDLDGIPHRGSSPRSPSGKIPNDPSIPNRLLSDS